MMADAKASQWAAAARPPPPAPPQLHPLPPPPLLLLLVERPPPERPVAPGRSAVLRAVVLGERFPTVLEPGLVTTVVRVVVVVVLTVDIF